MASVRKRKWLHKGEEREAWIVVYTDHGGKRRQKTFTLKKRADAFRLSVEVEIRDGTHTAERAAPLFADCCEAFLREMEIRHRNGDRMAGHTLESLKSRIAVHIVPRFGHMRVSAITSEAVESWVRSMRADYKAASLNQFVGRLFAILDYSVKRRWIRRNPLRDLPVRVHEPKRPRPRIPTKAEISTLLQTAWTLKKSERPTAYVNRIAIVSLGVFGGLRIGEVTGLQWQDIDFGKRLIRVRHSFSRYDGLKAPKTHAGERIVPLSRPIEEALLAVLAYWQRRVAMFDDALPSCNRTERRRLYDALASGRLEADIGDLPSGHIVRSTNGAAISNNYHEQLWKPLMEAAGLFENGKPAFSVHKLRHAAASLFIEAGLPAMNLKAVIGHANVSTTYNVYGHLFPEDRRVFEASDAIALSFSATNVQHDHLSH